MAVTAVRTTQSSANSPLALQVASIQVRRTRRRQRVTTADSRSSSRASAPKAFTTWLAPSVSERMPPMRVSHALDSRAAGATTRVASVTVSAP